MKNIKKVFAVSALLWTISGCSDVINKEIDFAGEYFFMVGNSCQPDKKSKNPRAFLELIKVNNQQIYKAKLPMAAAQNLPILSSEAMPIENKLSFTFYQQGEMKFMGSKPSIEMELKIQPHESLEDHIIMTKLAAHLSSANQTKTIDLIDSMKKDKKDSIYNQHGVTGVCLKKFKVS